MNFSAARYCSVSLIPNAFGSSSGRPLFCQKPLTSASTPSCQGTGFGLGLGFGLGFGSVMAYRSLGGPGVFLDQFFRVESQVVHDPEIDFAAAFQHVGAVTVSGNDAAFVGAAEHREIGEHGLAGGLRHLERAQIRALAVAEDLLQLVRRHAGRPCAAPALAATARALMIAACAGAASICCFWATC